MNQFIPILGTTALLGSALVGGVFFAFSSFVMKALAKVPSAEGIAAMQWINVVVINPSFLGAFMGTAVLSLGVGGLALTGWGNPSASFFLGAAVFYLVGTFLVTMLGNVPLNNQLAAVPATDPAALKVWEHYLVRWTRWNHVRTASAMVAALLISLGLMQNAGALDISKRTDLSVRHAPMCGAPAPR
jgi:uncharacterized membrane protein